jgi:cytochrome c
MYRSLIILFLLFLSIKLAGQPALLKINKVSSTSKYPEVESNRFEKITLSTEVEGPIELAVSRDGKVYFIERKGKVKVYDPIIQKTKLVGVLPVVYGIEFGLIGMALDPNFDNNHWIYLLNTRSVKPGKAGWGDPIEQYISRFTLVNGLLDKKTEKVLLKIPVDWQDHIAGSLEFDKAGNLYIAVGDNTSFTFYSATDAQRSSANTNDLRGKILRIHPEKNGTYSIPEGNLFARATKLARPEIYVMGCRNPYRLSIDPVSQYLYFSDVGPDASVDSVTLGPKGYDEINQVGEAGNFGWPYFTGNNKVYPRKDSLNRLFFTDTLRPVNYSPKNTGLNVLPAVRKPLLWYPYNLSPDFPVVGYGARTALVGPVYQHQSKNSLGFPKYYDKTLFIADWCRNWIKAVRLDKNNKTASIEPFLPGLHFDKPIDMTFGPDGSLYLLEYGMGESESKGSKLVKIQYNSGNRPPVAIATADRLSGAAPLKVKFSAEKSYDKDLGDALTYKWIFPGGNSTAETTDFTFREPGIYTVILVTTDKANISARSSLKIQVGNTAPEVNIVHPGKNDFYSEKFCYKVKVTDREDLLTGGINAKKIQTRFYYLKPGEILTKSGNVASEKALRGGQLIANSDCKSCHSLNSTSQIGPGFLSIAKKYSQDLKTETMLTSKVMQGGKGVWGKRAMPPHEGLSRDDAAAMVAFILNLEDNNSAKLVKESDCINMSSEKIGGKVILISSYRDKGTENVGPLKTTDTLILRSPTFLPVDFTEVRDVKKDSLFTNANDGGYAKLSDVNLTAVDSIRIRYSPGQGGRIEFRIDSVEGKLLQTLPIPLNSIANWNKWFTTWHETSLPLPKTEGRHDLYIVFRNEIFYYNMVNVAWVKIE